MSDNEAQQLSMEELETPILDYVDENVEDIPIEYSITSYGADYPVDGLVKRLKSHDITIPTFQRSYVWTIKQASRFIESLLLGLPVPGIFLSRERDSQKLLVIDGQQRLISLRDFYDGTFEASGRVFELSTGQKSRFYAKTYKSLDDDDRRRLDDSILHATIVKQDEPADEDSSIYNIFERLNTGGTLLQPQEIRASINQGAFQELLERLNSNGNWRLLYGPPNKNLRDQELILRFFALYYSLDSYKTPMKNFLNVFMRRNTNLERISGVELTRVFEETIDVIAHCIGFKAFKPQRALNAAMFDGIMVGVARRLKSGAITDCSTVKDNYNLLLANTKFVAASERATSNSDSVQERIALATEAFATVT